jgi:acyl-coenzyme A synthetase/AMP-(fatty) acid ligase
LNQTPSAFYGFMEVDQNKTDALALRYVIFGGEKLDASRLSKWLATHGENSPELINMYGITEGTIHVTFHKLTQNEISVQESLIGQPLSHMRAYVLNENRQRMPHGCPGELYIAGLGITAGYLNRVDETKQRFIPNPYTKHADFQTLYRTGDQVKTLPTGDLVYLGRLDTQVNFKGFRIERGEIEYQLNQCPYVKQSIVNIRNDNTASSELAAYVVLETQASPTPFVLREWLLRVLPPHMIPTKFFRITDIPLTMHGKIDYAALAGLEQTALVNPALSQTMQSVTARVSEIWKNTLHCQTIDRHQNFFDSGGDSLLLLQMQSELEAAFDYFPIQPLPAWQSICPKRCYPMTRTHRRMQPNYAQKSVGAHYINVKLKNNPDAKSTRTRI